MNVDQSFVMQSEKSVKAVTSDKWILPLQINGSVIPVKLDTGAKLNLICMSDIKSMKEKPHIQKKSVPLKACNGQMIDTEGVCRLKVEVKNRIHNLMFVIVPEGHDSLLGDQACEHLELVKRVQNVVLSTNNQSVALILQQFADVFIGFHVLPHTYQIQLKADAQPVVHAARRVPVPLHEQLRKELDRMTALGVIHKVEEPTDWVNSMVCVKKKNGEIRVCMDPKDLNENIIKNVNIIKFLKEKKSQVKWQVQCIFQA